MKNMNIILRDNIKKKNREHSKKVLCSGLGKNILKILMYKIFPKMTYRDSIILIKISNLLTRKFNSQMNLEKERMMRIS